MIGRIHMLLFLLFLIIQDVNAAATRQFVLLDPLSVDSSLCESFSSAFRQQLEGEGDAHGAMLLFLPPVAQSSFFTPASANSSNSIDQNRSVVIEQLQTLLKAGDKITYLAFNQTSTAAVVERLNAFVALKQADLRVTLFRDKEDVLSLSATASHLSQVSVDEVFCYDSDDAPFGYPAVLRKTRKLLASWLNVPPHFISPESDLIIDLGADHLQVYEMLQKLSNAFRVKAPLDELTVVSDIVAYIQGAESISMHKGISMRGGKDGGKDEKQQSYIQTVYYGTNRQRTGIKKPEEFYSGEREPAAKLHYGSVAVSIPGSHKSGALETPFMGFEFLRNPKQHLYIKTVNETSRELFFQMLNDKIANPGTDELAQDAIIFIHGFNVAFEEAARRTAQIAFDISFPGLPLFFSWPSDAKLLGYMADREDATWSIAYLEQFLNELKKQTDIKRFHLIAHSMGNQVLIGALHHIAMKNPPTSPLFENIILAAPDFDAELFEQQIASEVLGLASNWTIYASDKDMALNFSTSVNSTVRLGIPLTALEGMQVIDATGVEVSPWNVPEFHSYYATKSRVIKDLEDAIHSKTLDQRNLLLKTKNHIKYWELKKTGDVN